MFKTILATTAAISLSLCASLASADETDIHVSGQPYSAIIQREMALRMQNPPFHIAGDRYCVVPPTVGMAYRPHAVSNPNPGSYPGSRGMSPRR